MHDEGNDEEFVLGSVPKRFQRTGAQEKMQKNKRVDEFGSETNKEKLLESNQLNGKNEVDCGNRIVNAKGWKLLKKVNISANLRYFGIKKSFFLRFLNCTKSKGKKKINKDTVSWVIMITRKETVALMKLGGVVDQLVKKQRRKYFSFISVKFLKKCLSALLSLSKRRLSNAFFGILNQSYLTKIRYHHLQSSFERRLKFLLISERSQISRHFNKLKPEKQINIQSSPHHSPYSNLLSRSRILILLTLLSSIFIKINFFNYL